MTPWRCAFSSFLFFVFLTFCVLSLCFMLASYTAYLRGMGNIGYTWASVWRSWSPPPTVSGISLIVVVFSPSHLRSDKYEACEVNPCCCGVFGPSHLCRVPAVPTVTRMGPRCICCHTDFRVIATRQIITPTPQPQPHPQEGGRKGGREG